MPETIATDRSLFFIRKMPIFFLFLHENICYGYSLEAPHNVCVFGEIRKILCGYPLLSVAMLKPLDERQTVWTLIGFVCVEVLRPSQPNGVMSSTVSLLNHTFAGQA